MKKKILLLIILLVSSVFLFGCVTGSDYERQEQTIGSLQSEVRDLKDKLKLMQMKNERELSSTRAPIPELRLELERMRTDLQKLNNSVELAEKGPNPEGQALTLREQLDLIQARIARMETKLKLPPLTYEVINPSPLEITNNQGPNIEVVQNPASPETSLYNDAEALYKQKSYADALASFRRLIKEFPGSQYVDAAYFYSGECLFSQDRFEEAILEYNKVVKDYPKSRYVSMALLKQAYSFLNIGDKTSGKLLLQKVVRDYGESYAAGLAKKKLNTIN